MSPATKEFLKASTELLEAMATLVPILIRVVEEAQREETESNGEKCGHGCPGTSDNNGNCPSCGAYKG